MRPPANLTRWFYAVAIAVDVLANALTGGEPYESLSCRVGLSILSGGWAARVRWPAAWRRHFLAAVYTTIV